MKTPNARGQSGGRKAKRQKNEWGYEEDDASSDEELEPPSEDDVMVAIAKQHTTLKNLPKFWEKLSDETRSGLVGLYQDSDTPQLTDYLLILRDANREYRKREEWSEAGAKLGKKKYQPGGIADGDLAVSFMAIGNGDCIFIKTPAGSVIVLDCGTRSQPKSDLSYRKRIQDTFKNSFLKAGVSKKKTLPDLKALILTHPDQDHYNQLVPIIEPNIGKIQHLFHSADLTAYKAPPRADKTAVTPAPGRKVVKAPRIEAKTEEFLRTKTTIKNRVTIHAKQVKLTTTGATGTLPYTVDVAKKSIKILDEDWNGNKCEIILLAGEVSDATQTNREVLATETRPGQKFTDKRDRYAKPLKRGTGTDSNAGSIVTLIKAYGKKILLCGDATYLAEIFLLQNHKETIRNVELAQMEHHGSGTQHAGGVYVETINPLYSVASSGEHAGDENPRWRAIEKYLGLKKIKVRDKKQKTRPVRLKADVDAHTLEAYGDDEKSLIDLKTWQPHEKKALYSTRTNGDLGFILSPTGELTLGAKKTTT